MELRSFVKTALLDIISGVMDAQNETEPGTIVADVNTHKNFIDSRVTKHQVVDFEVSVRAEESKGSEGKLGVVSSFIGAGVSGKSANEQASASIIRFSVPVCLPISGKIPKYEDQ